VGTREISRRDFIRLGAAGGAALFLTTKLGGVSSVFAVPLAPGETLDPDTVAKWQTPLVIPPAMPRTAGFNHSGRPIDYYEIAVRQATQHILPESMGLDPTPVWSYASASHSNTFHYPAYTIEATWNRPVRVKWINQLVDASGQALPHLLPVDQTLHWANPPGGADHRDSRGSDPAPYTGPVPIVTHLHGGHSFEESDGYPEAWYLPDASGIPASYAREGSLYNSFKAKAEAAYGQEWEPGSAVFQYPNDQRATTLWYHDHTLGMTRLNVYAGPAGFYLIRRGPGDQTVGDLPGPAPARGDAAGKSYYEIPIVVQDRAFTPSGELWFPDNRAYFEGLAREQLQIPFIPQMACDGASDISPIWNPEFFGDVMVVNGKAWPYLNVEPRRYRLRLLNGCNSRFLILKMSDGRPFTQIGSEGGFLPEPVQLQQLLIGPAERADVIVDFTDVAAGTEIIMENIGPDEPFGGGVPGTDFPVSNPDTTGQVMKFIVGSLVGVDTSAPAAELGLPPRTPLPNATRTRKLSLNEQDSNTVKVTTDANGNVVLDCANGTPFGPRAALLGTLGANGMANPMEWMSAPTETPKKNETEVWEIYNFTADAHPIHVHQVMFQVLNRQDLQTDANGMVTEPATLVADPIDPETWETGWKDTVIAYPGQVTRIKSRFEVPGLFVWHCHIVDHEDNEMMRPYRVMPGPPAAPTSLRARSWPGFRVRLTWVDNATNEDAYYVERYLGGGRWQRLARLPAGRRYYYDRPPGRYRYYAYRVRCGRRTLGYSGYSNVTWAKTLP